MEKYRIELLQNESTQDTRIAAMRDRVSELRTKREEERKKVVEQKLGEQWRFEF